MVVSGYQQLIEEHLSGSECAETLRAFEELPHEKELYYDTQENLVGLASYFPLERLDFDMIVILHKDNKFSLSQWKWLKHKLMTRIKPIKIQITANKEHLEYLANKYGGYLDGSVLVFP